MFVAEKGRNSMKIDVKFSKKGVSKFAPERLLRVSFLEKKQDFIGKDTKSYKFHSTSEKLVHLTQLLFFSDWCLDLCCSHHGFYIPPGHRTKVRFGLSFNKNCFKYVLVCETSFKEK